MSPAASWVSVGPVPDPSVGLFSSQVETEEKQQQVQDLQGKVSDLQRLGGTQEVPVKLQVP